jgi:hypothetical protein
MLGSRRSESGRCWPTRADPPASGLSSMARNLSRRRPTAHARPHPPLNLTGDLRMGDSGGVVSTSSDALA